jgi:hypothetical protein
MLSGVALALSELPVEVMERHGLTRHVHGRYYQVMTRGSRWVPQLVGEMI